MHQINHIELILPSWAALMAEDLLAEEAMQRIELGELELFRFRVERFDRLDIAARLIERKLPFDGRIQRKTADDQCQASLRRVRFDADGRLLTDIEDVPTELGNVFLGLLEAVHHRGEHAAVSAFLQEALRRKPIEPLRETAPLPEQITALREAEELQKQARRLRWRRVH